MDRRPNFYSRISKHFHRKKKELLSVAYRSYARLIIFHYGNKHELNYALICFGQFYDKLNTKSVGQNLVVIRFDQFYDTLNTKSVGQNLVVKSIVLYRKLHTNNLMRESELVDHY